MVTARALGMQLRIALVAGRALLSAHSRLRCRPLRQSATVARPPANDEPPVDIVTSRGAVDSEPQPLPDGSER